MFKHPVAHRTHTVATKSIADVMAKLKELADEEETRQLKNIVLKYEGAFDVGAAFDVTLGKWARTKSLVCVGAVEGGMLIYVRKEDKRALPTNLELRDINGSMVKPGTFRFAYRGHGAERTTVIDISSVMTTAATNLVIRVSDDGCEYTFDYICAATKHLSKEQIVFLRGKANTKPHNERTDFQKAFLRSFGDLMMTREIRSKSNALVFSAYEPTMAIVPFEKLINLKSQKGTRLQEVSMQTETYDLLDLFTKPLLSKYGIVILGTPETTGFGKTQYALRLAVERCIAYNRATNSPRDEAQIVFSNTLDACRDVTFRKGYVLVVDEFCPEDQTQAQSMSENMLKGLMSPMQPCTFHCRNQDGVLPAGVPRIFTANAESAQAWCGNRLKWSEPLQRKAVVFSIKQPLCDDSWRQQGGEAVVEDDGDATEVARLMAERVGA